LSTSALYWSILFGSFGLGYFMYGRKQKAVVPMVCGLLLLVYPYFVTNDIALPAIGFALIAIPWFLKI
jgi:hypothetical protein